MNFDEREEEEKRKGTDVDGGKETKRWRGENGEMEGEIRKGVGGGEGRGEKGVDLRTDGEEERDRQDGRIQRTVK